MVSLKKKTPKSAVKLVSSDFDTVGAKTATLPVSDGFTAISSFGHMAAGLVSQVPYARASATTMVGEGTGAQGLIRQWKASHWRKVQRTKFIVNLIRHHWLTS